MKSIVLKVGGSLMFDRNFDLNVKVLEVIKRWYKEKKDYYDIIVFVVGGGKLSREVGGKIKKYVKNVNDVHSVSMELTQTNAYILKGFLGDDKIFNPETLGEAYEFLMHGKGIMVSGGLRHGWSTDMDAAVFADILGCRKVHKLSDIKGLYTSDPSENPTAKLVKDITWSKYRKMFGITRLHDEHSPNLHIPISAECSLFAENKGITFFVSGGSTFDHREKLDHILESGTMLHP